MRQWLKSHWGNGLRFQIAISLLILGCVIALYLQFRNFAEQGSSDIHIESVAVVDPSTPEGGTIVWSQLICNESDEPVSLSISVHFVSAEPPEREEIVPGNLASVAQPGCHPGPERASTLPVQIAAGLWRLRILVTSTADGLIRFTSKDSEPFTVIEGEGSE